MSPFVTLRCPGCNARIKAPAQLIGQSRACPGCGAEFVVRPQVPESVGPVLVSDSPAVLDRPSFAMGWR